ncbi:hypothetical protein BOX15_Mlig001526g10, partial [Macrostomum lignano]
SSLDPQSPGGENRPVGQHSPIRDQDRFLPIANISKIMKRTIPETGKITKEAKECVQECVSEFISFITSEASDRCQDDKRKTMNGEDILTAMQAVGLDNYIEPLKLYLLKYREANKLEAANERAGSAGASASASGGVNQDTPSAASSADASGAAPPPSVVSAPTAVTLAGLENSNGQVVYRVIM